jgi:protein-S-isoprenylcysteine O-methyltransferase Ste14
LRPEHSLRERQLGDFLLFGVTAVELALLVLQTPTFTYVDWIYISQHLIVLGLALTRRTPITCDYSARATAAVVVAYAYPYAQVVYLGWSPGDAVSPNAGLILVTIAAVLSLASLVSLGRSFGILPASRGLVNYGAYRLVRHPMYVAYVLSDIGYMLQEWNVGSLLLVLAGWTSLLYRIHAEERVLSRDDRWTPYVASVPYRLFPGLW